MWLYFQGQLTALGYFFQSIAVKSLLELAISDMCSSVVLMTCTQNLFIILQTETPSSFKGTRVVREGVRLA